MRGSRTGSSGENKTRIAWRIRYEAFGSARSARIWCAVRRLLEKRAVASTPKFVLRPSIAIGRNKGRAVGVAAGPLPLVHRRPSSGHKVPVIRAFLYDAKGEDREIDLKTGKLPKLAKDQLIWLEVVGRDEADIRRLKGLLGLKPQVVADLLEPEKPSLLNNYGDYFHCTVLSPDIEEETATSLPSDFKSIRLDFLVGREWLVTIADEDIPFLTAFREQDRRETLIGILSAASLAASLLDWHLAKFLTGLERLETFLDGLDVRLLAGKPINGGRLKEIVAAQRYIAHLRRTLAPQRAVFYGLSRPDFALVAAADAVEPFKAVEHRFERALGYIEHGHELVRGSFDLLTARLAESTNVLIRRLTFLSIMLGVIGAVAGIFGMNFETDYAKTGVAGFWIVVGTLLTIVTTSLVIGRLKRWI